MPETETIPKVTETDVKEASKASTFRRLTLLISAIGVSIVVLNLFFYLKKDSEVKSDKKETTAISKAITDTLQNRSIDETKSSLNAVNCRVDIVQSKVNRTEANVTNIANTLQYYFGKFDKSIGLLLQQQSSDLKLESIQPSYVAEYTHADSVCVKGNNESYNSIYEETFEGVFLKRINPLSNIILIKF